MSTQQSVIEPELSPTRPLGPWANGVSLSAEEFDSATDWDDDYRYELVRGMLIVSPAPGEGERGPNSELGYLLLDYKYRHPSGNSLDETLEEQTWPTTAGRRRMDRAIWAGYGRPIKTAVDVPTIAVEIVSGNTRDRRRDFVDKRQEYADAGVVEYWIIDRFRRTLTIFCGNDVRVVKETETYSSPLLPGFELPLARLLARADRLEATDENL